jgi:hypothetical protein
LTKSLWDVDEAGRVEGASCPEFIEGVHRNPSAENTQASKMQSNPLRVFVVR